MKKTTGSWILVVAGILLIGGCASSGNFAQDTRNNLNQADLGYAILKGSFDAFCAEQALPADVCAEGAAIAREWDANFSIVQNLLAQLDEGKATKEEVQAASEAATRVGIRLAKFLREQNSKPGQKPQ